MTDIVSSNPFWLFLGIVAGVLIQQLVLWLERHRQASAALKVLKVEIGYNLKQAEIYMNEITKQKERLSNSEVTKDKIFFPMAGFDYSALGPINNSGFLHALLGAEKLGIVLRFSGHFNRLRTH